jgi:hypothetical protein
MKSSLWSGLMPLSRLLQNTAFEPAEIDALIEAFETICRGLRLGKNHESLREKIAQKVIAFAELGERDPQKISQIIIKDMRGASPSPVRQSGRSANCGLAPQDECQARSQS